MARREGPGPAVLAVHATGFCKELWDPVGRRLLPRAMVALDQRGHGDSSTPPLPYDWWDLGRDVLAVVAACGLDKPIGLGHSSGSAALVLAELLHPGTFGALALVEPIIFNLPPARVEDFAMTRTALRRRRSFPSPQAAAAAWRGRGPFASWPEEALALYVEHALRPDGAEWVLKCAPETEAEFYRGAPAHGAWARLPEVACPVVLLAGEQSDSHPRTFMEEMRGRFVRAELVMVPGAGHFLPMERPDVVAAAATRLAGGEAEAAGR